jgi:hypothetical protein
VEKSSPRSCSTSAIFIKLPKEKKRPMGENSPNSVALTSFVIEMSPYKMKTKPI